MVLQWNIACFLYFSGFKWQNTLRCSRCVFRSSHWIRTHTSTRSPLTQILHVLRQTATKLLSLRTRCEETGSPETLPTQVSCTRLHSIRLRKGNSLLNFFLICTFWCLVPSFIGCKHLQIMQIHRYSLNLGRAAREGEWSGMINSSEQNHLRDSD